MRWCEVRDSVKKARTACLVKFSRGMRYSAPPAGHVSSQELSCIITPGSQKVPLGSHGHKCSPSLFLLHHVELCLDLTSSVKPSLIAAGGGFLPLFKLLSQL